MENALVHTGVPGMKWYVRRWQNKDGSLTPAGKIRYGKNSSGSESKSDAHTQNATPKNKKPHMKDTSTMTIDELREAKTREDAEREYKEAYLKNHPAKTPIAKKVLTTVFDKVIEPAALDSGKKVLTTWLTDNGQKLINNFTEDEIRAQRKKK